MIRPTRRLRCPSVEILEGRALMSGASPYLPFGSGGTAQISFGTGQTNISSEVTQADGKILVLGTLYTPDEGVYITTSLVARLDANGQFDPTFGTEGLVELASGPTSNGGINDLLTDPSFVESQADGKILLIGASDVLRLDSNGAVDTTFGTGGKVSLQGLTGSSDTTLGYGLEPDGKIVAVVSVLSGGEFNSIELLGFNADGSTDTTFGTSGVVTTTFTASLGESDPAFAILNHPSLLVQPDGKLDIAQGITVLRVNTDGSPDTSFGTAGYAQVADPTGGTDGLDEVIDSIAIQPDGKLVVAGYSEDQPLSETSNYHFFAARLDANGTPDSTFGGGSGVATIGLPGANPGGNLNNFPPPPPVSAESVAIAPDGKIVLGGYQIDQAALAVLEPDGTPDTSFGRDGNAIIASSGEVAGLSVLADGVILATTTANGSLQAFMLAGASGDFDGDGVSDPAVYLPSYGAFAYRPSSGGADVIEPFGIAGAGQTIPAPGDYDVSGRTELGVYLPALGEFAYRPADGGADVLIPFGFAGAGQTIPALGYYDGTGRQDIAAYLPSLGVYAIRTYGKLGEAGSDELIPFGIAGAGQSIPVPGDYEGTGIDDIAVYLPSIGAYAIRPSTGGADEIIPFGIAGAGQSIPMPGDYDGSGKTELGVYLPALGDFIYRPANGGPDVVVSFGIAGAGQTLPAVGDYTGSGHDELGIYLPSLGLYAYRPGLPAAPTGADVVLPFGIAGAGQTIPFTADPASNALPTAVASASVSAESASWVDVVPMAAKLKKSADGQVSTDVLVLG